MPYALVYDEDWNKHFRDFDKTIQVRLIKKLEQLKIKGKSRHLGHGVPFFVEEVGGYRIVFTVDEASKTKKIWFVGNHKQYEKWYST